MNYDMGRIGMHFNELLSVSEAAEIWGVDESTIRKAIVQGRLVDGKDCRKFGKQWVVTATGMAKAFKDGGGPSFFIWAEYLGRHNPPGNRQKSSETAKTAGIKKAPQKAAYRLLKELVKFF